MSNYFNEESEFIADKLIAGTKVSFIVQPAEICSGQGFLKRGTAVGQGSDGKFYVLGSDISGIDIVPYGILTDDIDTSNNSVNAFCYLSGIFNKNAVTLYEGADINDYELELRKLSIYLEDIN